eukprot:CAMPEP_0201508102 /NCGR_PEP_ID=MMETSP0161_2-20130828/1560_1 /ASSEMBLY_ACC=CAM_ASM_000251 /TAXON_ID=180227 /ORGANISM="Neoparamoeba aestuarina, Strain SoJaBio B1-5/56/2" /LENGTH=320 /DNA_ID=CAMNT_0047902651 /DNA_START=96 /DNA_END=1058 /DNA_ORIENTATION=+
MVNEFERSLKRRKVEDEEEKEEEGMMLKEKSWGIFEKKGKEKEEKKEKKEEIKKRKFTQTISITYGDQAENHVGMQMIGRLSESGFGERELVEAKRKFEEMGGVAELIDLRESSGVKSIQKNADPAFVLVLRKGVDVLLKERGETADDFFDEQVSLDADKKAFMYGRIVNKIARHNLCFSEEGQEPDYENKKGRIVGYSSVPLLSHLRDSFPELLGEKGEGLVAEGNYYYDVSKCGIGFHGDGERKKVVAVRLGASLPLHYQWFVENGVVGNRVKLVLNHGDVYVMSEKATGNDWKKRKDYTLRHAAGCEKFLKIKGSVG